MPRKSLGSRLYLDPKRKQWTIRDGGKFVRLGTCTEEQAAQRLKIYQRRRSGGTRDGMIYVVGFGEYVKIGFTSVPLATRLKYLKVSMPEAPTVYGLFPGTQVDERRLHKRFSAFRLNGEWFSLTGAMTMWVASLEVKGLEGATTSPENSTPSAISLRSLVGGDGLEPPTLSV